MNKLKIPEFIALFEEFKKSEDYAFRIKQSEFTVIAKEIIEETLRNEPLTNGHLTGLIQMLKADTSPESFIKYLSLNIPDKNKRESILQKKNQLGYTGYTGAGKAAIRVLSPTQLSNVKIFLKEAFKILTITQAKNLTDNFDDLNIPELKQGIYSPWLHYIKPDLFPIINNSHNDLLQWFGMDRKYSSCIDDFSELKKVTGESQLGTLDFFAFKVKLNPVASSKKHGRSESNEDLADRLLRENANEESILESFRNIYKVKKNITDERFVEERAGAYMRQAKRKALKSGKVLPSDQPSKTTVLSTDYFPKNVILYGPPGTGKTYNTINKALEILGENIDGKSRQEIKDLFDLKMKEGQIAFTTFHQSMSYEDFVEGIKPIEPEKEGDPVVYRIELGVFRILCVEASFAIAQLRDDNTTKQVLDFSILYDKFVEDIEERLLNGQQVKLETKAGGTVMVENISQQNNIIIKHHEGTRTYTVSKARLNKLQSSIADLEDLNNINNQFRAIIGGSNSSAYWSVLNAIRKIKPTGPIIRENRTYTFDEKKEVVNSLTKSDYKNINGKPFVLIIDEINRGNVSQIFGELITLIEEDKRLGKCEALEAVLPYSKEPFGVPPNLYVIGTMNTADRSVEAIDTALRRRFCFEEKSPKYDLKELEYTLSGYKASSILETINKRIEKLLDKDHTIGHSYFIFKDVQNPTKSFINSFYKNIIPLLQEYFFGDYGKIGLILGQGFVSKKEWNLNSDSFAEFEYESASEFEDRSVYKINDYRSEIDGSDKFLNAIRILMNEKIE